MRARGNIPMLAAATGMIETDELKPKARKALFDVIQSFRRWQENENTSHAELAEQILEGPATPTCGRLARPPTPPPASTT